MNSWREKIEEARAKLKELFWDELALIEVTKTAKIFLKKQKKQEKRKCALVLSGKLSN